MEKQRRGDIEGSLGGGPEIGLTEPGARYLGRVVVELWEENGSTDSQNLAFRTESTSLEGITLLQRVANALPLRAELLKQRAEQIT